jgi:hypothetical protein
MRVQVEESLGTRFQLADEVRETLGEPAFEADHAPVVGRAAVNELAMLIGVAYWIIRAV